MSHQISTTFVRTTVEKCENLTLLEDFEGPNTETKVFLNGLLIGMSEDPDALLDELRTMRDLDIIHRDISISYDEIDDEIRVFSDEGRLIRPLLRVEDEEVLVGPNDTDWNDLVENNKIRYLDSSEIEEHSIAMEQNELKQYKADYCEISGMMMLGVMASAIPFSNHSQSPRNIYQSSMGKQAIGIFATSQHLRTDTIAYSLNSPQRPLVSTAPSRILGFDDMPSGINAIVAIGCYSG